MCAILCCGTTLSQRRGRVDFSPPCGAAQFRRCSCCKCLSVIHISWLRPTGAEVACTLLQVAGDSNVAGQVYPDQSLYPCNSVPALVERINNALTRADQIEHAEGSVKVSRSGLPNIIILQSCVLLRTTLNPLPLLHALVRASMLRRHQRL